MHFAICFAPHQPDWQPAPQLTTRRLVENATIQPSAQDVELGFLCRPRDYADLGVRSRRLGDDYQPAEVGIIYKPSRYARTVSEGW